MAAMRVLTVGTEATPFWRRGTTPRSPSQRKNVLPNAKQTTEDRIAVMDAKAQAVQAADAAAKDKINAEDAAHVAVQTVETFDQHAAVQAEQITALGNQAQAAIAQDKADVQAAAEQTSRDANAVNMTAAVIAQQAEETQKAAVSAEDAADRSEKGAAQVEEIVAGYNADLVKRLCMPFSAKGSIVICHPVEAHPLQVVSHIEPVQEGSGAPSPDNVRPMKGFTGAKLVRCGKNILNQNQLSVNGDRTAVSVTRQDDGSIHVVSTGPQKETYVNVSNIRYSRYDINTDKANNDGLIAKDCSFAARNLNTFFTVHKGEVLDKIMYPQIELSQVPTVYEPYQGNEYSVQFGQTMHGGSYDWDKGELTLTHKVFELKVSDMNNNEDFPGWNNVSGIGADTGLGDGTSYQQVQSNVGRANVNTQSGNKTIFMSKGVYNLTQSEWKKQYPNLTIQVLMPYRKGTYPVIKLTPQQILALSGVNNLYSDTGDTTVQGRCDLKYEMQQLKDAIAALGAV